MKHQDTFAQRDTIPKELDPALASYTPLNPSRKDFLEGWRQSLCVRMFKMYLELRDLGEVLKVKPNSVDRGLR